MESGRTKDVPRCCTVKVEQHVPMDSQTETVISTELTTENDENVIIEGTIEKPVWTSQNIIQLLKWVEELRPLVGKRKPYSKKTDMWREIRRRFEEWGCFWTLTELISKFGDLIREYNIVTRQNQLTGREDKKFAYKSELDRIFHVTPNETVLPYTEFWPQAKVNLLLSSIETLLPKIRDPRKCFGLRSMWTEIHRRFVDAGYNTTKKQMCNKFTGLVRQYKTQRIRRRMIERKPAKLPCESQLERIISHWPKRDSDRNNNYEQNSVSEEAVDDPCMSSSAESQSVSPYHNSYGNNQSILVDKNTKKDTIERSNIEAIRDDYYRLKQEYLRRKIEYITKKEAHMMRKEVLLESVLKVLSNKENKK